MSNFSERDLQGLFSKERLESYENVQRHFDNFYFVGEISPKIGHYMSKKERVKSKIDLLKTFIVACLTALFGVVSFTALYYDTITRAKLCLAIGGIVILLVALAYFLYSYGKELDRLEKL